MKGKNKFWYSFLGLLFCSIVSAQRTLTFEDCINIAVENNLTLKNSKISEKIANYQLNNSSTHH